MSIVASKYIEKLKSIFALSSHGTHVSASTCVTSFNGSVGAVTASMGTVIPSGAIMWFNLTSAPSGWVVCDGTNGTPNLIGKYPLGASSSIGTAVAAGLPNITGNLVGVNTNTTHKSIVTGGAFSIDTASGELSTGTGGGSGDYVVKFNASNSNSIYGNSNTVTPPSVNLLPCQKI